MSKREPEDRSIAEAPGCLAWVVAIVAAAIGASVVWGWYELVPFVFVGALFIASVHMALAIPIYFALARRYRMKFWIALGASVLIGALPASAVAALSGPWRDLPEIAAAFGFSGACGGLAFWLTLKLGSR